jgi:hypothetical protein
MISIFPLCEVTETLNMYFGKLATPLSLQEEFAGVVARVESLPLAPLGDFVRGRMGESERQALW